MGSEMCIRDRLNTISSILGPWPASGLMTSRKRSGNYEMPAWTASLNLSTVPTDTGGSTFGLPMGDSTNCANTRVPGLSRVVCRGIEGPSRFTSNEKPFASFSPLDDPKADMAGGGVDHLWLAGRRSVTEAVLDRYPSCVQYGRDIVGGRCDSF